MRPKHRPAALGDPGQAHDVPLQTLGRVRGEHRNRVRGPRGPGGRITRNPLPLNEIEEGRRRPPAASGRPGRRPSRTAPARCPGCCRPADRRGRRAARRRAVASSRPECRQTCHRLVSAAGSRRPARAASSIARTRSTGRLRSAEDRPAAARRPAAAASRSGVEPASGMRGAHLPAQPAQRLAVHPDGRRGQQIQGHLTGQHGRLLPAAQHGQQHRDHRVRGQRGVLAGNGQRHPGRGERPPQRRQRGHRRPDQHRHLRPRNPVPADGPGAVRRR